MKIYHEIDLKDFEPWSGACYLFNLLTEDELDTVQYILEDCPPESGYTETDINDLFWFDGDCIAEWLGYEDEESLIKAKEKRDDD